MKMALFMFWFHQRFFWFLWSHPWLKSWDQAFVNVPALLLLTPDFLNLKTQISNRTQICKLKSLLYFSTVIFFFYILCTVIGFCPWVRKIPWSRERLPTPVFCPGDFHGLYSPWGWAIQLGMTEWLSLSFMQLYFLWVYLAKLYYNQSFQVWMGTKGLKEYEFAHFASFDGCLWSYISHV